MFNVLELELRDIHITRSEAWRLVKFIKYSNCSFLDVSNADIKLSRSLLK